MECHVSNDIDFSVCFSGTMDQVIDKRRRQKRTGLRSACQPASLPAREDQSRILIPQSNLATSITCLPSGKLT